jgi:sugar phosphate isomerase/epimerase
VHAPSAFAAHEEREIAQALLPVARRGWLVVVHPDTIHDPRAWEPFGDRLAIENMDPRKPVGRTVEELRPVFSRLPNASFCLDLAHAWQCDPTMSEAARLLAAFGERLAEVHVSELDAASRHIRLSDAGIEAYLRFAELIPIHIPVIIEAPVQPHEIDAELEASLEALGRACTV